MPEYPCVTFENLFIYFFSMRAAFGLDSCCHFFQCIKVLLPLIGYVKVHDLPVLPGMWGQ